MTLFSAPADPWSHRTRIVLAEKSIAIDVVDVEPGKYPEDLLDLNPYHTVPTLVDRDLVLYDSRVIIEYLDERFIGSSGIGTPCCSRSRRRTRGTCRSCARCWRIRSSRAWTSSR
jgi:glutathione S-transferase